MANYSQELSISGLETLTIVVPVAGQFVLKGKISLPRLAGSDATDPNYLSYPSQVVATVKQNGSTIFTSLPGQMGFFVNVNAASQDSFTVQLSSSAAQDAVLNAVKAVVSIG